MYRSGAFCPHRHSARACIVLEASCASALQTGLRVLGSHSNRYLVVLYGFRRGEVASGRLWIVCLEMLIQLAVSRTMFGSSERRVAWSRCVCGNEVRRAVEGQVKSVGRRSSGLGLRRHCGMFRCRVAVICRDHSRDRGGGGRIRG